jgi:hypothetical protein
LIGGHAPTPSSAITNANGWPCRKSLEPEHGEVDVGARETALLDGLLHDRQQDLDLVAHLAQRVRLRERDDADVPHQVFSLICS